MVRKQISLQKHTLHCCDPLGWPVLFQEEIQHMYSVFSNIKFLLLMNAPGTDTKFAF